VEGSEKSRKRGGKNKKLLELFRILITILSLKDSSNKKSKRSDFLNEKNYK
jgi:hypothetical protein